MPDCRGLFWAFGLGGVFFLCVCVCCLGAAIPLTRFYWESQGKYNLSNDSDLKKSIRWDARGVRLALVTASGFGEMSCFSSDLAIQITGIRCLVNGLGMGPSTRHRRRAMKM